MCKYAGLIIVLICI